MVRQNAASRSDANFTTKLMAVLLALVLCVGLMPIAPAWAEESAEGAEETFSVALTIVDQTEGNKVIANKKVDGLTADMTVEEMLGKAGFSKVENASDLKSDMDFRVVFKCSPCFGVKDYNPDTDDYWVTMFEGSGLTPTCESAYVTAAVQPNKHYQYIYGKAGSFAYDEVIVDPLAASSDGDEEEGSGDQGSNEPLKLDLAKLDALHQNVLASFDGTENEVEALILAAAGMKDRANLESVKELCVSYISDPSAANLQKAVLVLTAFGVDATSAEVDGTTYNFVDEMGKAYGPDSTINSRAFMLMAYASGPYETTSGMTVDEIIDSILKEELPDGGFAFYGSDIDVDITGQVLTAFALYRDRPEVSAAIDRALAALKAVQNTDGGFASPWGGMPSNSNAPSTGTIVAALCALGIDPTGSDWAKDGQTPVSCLLKFANDDNTGFTYAGSGAVMPICTTDGVRALVSYKAVASTGKAFNPYVPVALKDQQPGGEGEQPGGQAPGAGNQTPESGSSSGQVAGGTALAQTGDGAVGVAALLGAAVLGSLACALSARRKVSVSADSRARSFDFERK